jgi:chromosome segregation ATPase
VPVFARDVTHVAQQVANLQQSNELSLQAVKKAADALAASHASYERLCALLCDAEAKRNAIEDTLLDGRVQLQQLQREVEEVEAECRRDEDALRDLQLKDAAAAGGSVQVSAQPRYNQYPVLFFVSMVLPICRARH